MENKTFRTKLIKDNSKTFKPKFFKVSTSIDTKIDTSTTKPFKAKLIKDNSKTFKPEISERSASIDTKIDTGATKPSEDIYYDEIVYYDGGGVDGYDA